MGEYVININWNGGKGSGNSKGNTTPTAFLAGAAASAITANTLFKSNGGFSSIDDNIRERSSEKAYEWRDPSEFFFGRKNYYADVTEMEDVESGIRQTVYSNPTTEITWHKKPIVYTAAQGLRIANKLLATHYQYASAIASSTAELNAINEYQNAMTGIGLATSIAAGTAVGAKIGAASGPVGAAIGAGIGAAVAITNKAVNTWNANRILNYKQAINATTSAYQLGVLGDATYGRSRQSIG